MKSYSKQNNVELDFNVKFRFLRLLQFLRDLKSLFFRG